MARSTQIQAASLLILLLVSLTSSNPLQQQMRHPAELQPWHTAEASPSRPHLIQNRRKRDSHVSICRFCCKCCSMLSCGFCCLT